MHLTRERVRFFGAAVAATMAIIYFLIGLGVLNVGGTTTGETIDLFGFGAAAGGAFLLLAVLLMLVDKRWLWIAALTFQVLVYVMYVGVSGTRSPQFELWGILLRIIQLGLVGALVYLSIRAPETEAGSQAV